MIFKVPFSYSILKVTPKVPVSGTTATIIGLSGGFGQALVSLFFLWIMTFFEKQNVKRFLIVIGFEIAFLTVGFLGAITSLLEGLFYTDYQLVHDNPFILIMLLFSSFSISFLLIRKWKFEKLKAMLIAKSYD
jgi:hypothetical protein